MKLKYNLVWFFFLLEIPNFHRLCFRIAPDIHPDHVPYILLYVLITESVLLVPAAVFVEHVFRVAGKLGKKNIFDLSKDTGIYLWGMILSAMATAISILGLCWMFKSGDTSLQIYFSSASFIALIAVRIRVHLLLKALKQDK